MAKSNKQKFAARVDLVKRYCAKFKLRFDTSGDMEWEEDMGLEAPNLCSGYNSGPIHAPPDIYLQANGEIWALHGENGTEEVSVKEVEDAIASGKPLDP